ncbi:outer membrane beta-barrel protein [Ferruginibacter sp. SUN106]|uniref:outer membrane beta-barrel protein n=1 Tax=Ferruginibacter sp. SUN106 TaxID=2978348 RepID=UPI003D366468
MKQLITFLALAIICTSATAQDSTKKSKSDTIRIGGIIIVKNGKKDNPGKENKDFNITMGRHDNAKKKNANVSTNWWIVDLGFANYTDNTNYTTANTDGYLKNRPGYPTLDKNDFKLRSGKSVNVNVWFFMQRLNLVKHYVNLKYGVGLELNNYRYKSSLSYKEGGTIPYSVGLGANTNAPFIFRDSISFSKNKLAADYLTVPLMLNFTSNPGSHKKGISLSAGVSAGYLYSQRNKQRSSERGKDRNKGDYDLSQFKFSYVAELGLGRIRFYGSYSPQSFYDHSLDMKPYNVGIRFSNW